MALIKCPECKKKISETVESCPYCGYRFNPGETAKLAKQENVTKIISYLVLAVLVILFLRWCSSGNENTESQLPWYQQDNSSGAWVYTQYYVKAQLKSPRSAKFPWDYTKYVERDGTTYTINGYVDAENSFGAMIRTYFHAIVREKSKDNWEMVSFKFEK